MTQTDLRGFVSDLFSANKPAWLVTTHPADRLATFLLALCFSAWWLAVAVMAQFALGISSKLRIYIAMMIIVPLAVIGTVLLIQRLKQSLDVPPGRPFYEPLLAFDSLFILFALLTSVPVMYDVRLALANVLAFALANGLIVWRLAGLYGAPSADTRDERAIRLTLALAALIPVGMVGAVYTFGKLDTRSWYVNAEVLFPVCGLLMLVLPAALYHRAYRLIPFAAGLIILLFARRFVADVGLILPISIVAGIVPALLIRPRPEAENRARFAWPEGLIVLWLALIMVNLYFPSDRLHYNAFLAHVNDVVHGKTLFVDSHPQYGLGLTYFLSALFGSGVLPLSYAAFSLVNAVLLVVEGGLIYLMLRTVIKAWWICALAVTVMAGMLLWQVNFVSLYLPSGGPIRFLPIYLLLSALALRLRSPGRGTILEYLMLVLCAGWGFETLIYGVVVYLATRFFEIAITRPPFREAMTRALRLVPPVIAAVVLPLAAIQVFTFLRAGVWPVWQVYFELVHYIGTASKAYTLAISFWSEWIFVLGISLGSLILLALKYVYSARPEALQPYILPFAMTVWGVVQFSYFVADPSVITNVMAPALFLAAFWYAQINTARLPVDFARLLSYLVYVLVIFELVSAVVTANSDLNATPAGLAIQRLLPPESPFNLAERWNAPPDALIFRPPDTRGNRRDGQAAAGLIERYAASQDRVAVLIAPDSSVEALLTTHKADVFPLGDVTDQSFSPISNQRAVDFPHHLQAGDVVLIALRFPDLLPVQKAIVERLCREFSLHPAEVLPSGIAAIRLDSSQNTSGACSCGEARLECPGAN